MDNFSHIPNTKRENTNAIFTSEKIDKSDKLVATLKDLTINDAEYNVSNSATVDDAKGDPTSNLTKVTHTSDGKGKVADTSNRSLQQKLLSNQTLPVVFLTMDPSIDNSIATIGGASETLAVSATKKVVADTAPSGTWFNQTPRHVSQTGRDSSNPGDTDLAVRPKPAPYPVLIGSTTI